MVGWTWGDAMSLVEQLTLLKDEKGKKGTFSARLSERLLDAFNAKLAADGMEKSAVLRHLMALYVVGRIKVVEDPTSHSGGTRSRQSPQTS